MSKKKIMAVPVVCFWAVIAVCLLGILIGSFCDYRINAALANKTELGAFFATYGSWFSYCLYPAAGACLFAGLRKKGENYTMLAWVLLILAGFWRYTTPTATTERRCAPCSATPRASPPPCCPC